MRFVWVSDLHFDSVDAAERHRFSSLLRRMPAEAIVITGDISNARRCSDDLITLSYESEKMVYFCLGNHDYYGSNIATVDSEISAFSQGNETMLRLLGQREIIPMGTTAGLIGHRGWADGWAGKGVQSPLFIQDTMMIADFRSLHRKEMFDRFSEMGMEAANYFREILPIALFHFDEVWVATHFPPFPGSTWGPEGLADEDHLPYACNLAAGETILEVARTYPDKRITVLCGHTHGRGFYLAAPNVRAFTASAKPGSLDIANTFVTDHRESDEDWQAGKGYVYPIVRGV